MPPLCLAVLLLGEGHNKRILEIGSGLSRECSWFIPGVFPAYRGSVGRQRRMRQRRLVPDLETWLERSGSLTEANRDLLKLLRLSAAEAGQLDSAEAGVLAYYRIHRAIPSLIGKKLRAERRAQHDKVVKGIRQRQHGTKDWHVRLVRIKAYEFGIGRPRQSREQAQQLALQDFRIDEGERRVIWKESDLKPVERRALAILNGAPRVAKKNFLERRAITLADAVIAEWFSPRGKQGRPVGSKMKLAGKAMHPRLPSVAEVIEAILPIIEQLAGPASSSPRSTVIKAIASAVRSSADLNCTPELAASVVRDLRRTRGSSTT
jgi:hypothetical protein